MKKRIVFFDIDGTLLDHKKKLPPETKKAIKILQENGVYVAIATGRAPFMFESLREELGIETFVSFNGQYVVFEGEVVFENPLAFDQLQALHEKSERTGHPMVFLNDKEMKATQLDHHHIGESLGSLKFDYPDKDVDFYHNETIYQALLFCEQGEEKQYVDTYKNFNFIRWHSFSTDVLPMGGSKAIGIEKVLKRAGIEIADSYAFGDGLNDKEMLRFVGTGVTMGNAPDEVKDCGDIITRDVSDGGLVQGLKLVGLI